MTEMDPTPHLERLGLRLCSPLQITVATVCGSPIAGGWLRAGNHRLLGRRGSWLTILEGIVVTALLFPAWGRETSIEVARLLMVLAYAIWVGRRDKATYDYFRSSGGQRRSSWYVLGVCAVVQVVLGLVVTALVLGALLAILSRHPTSADGRLRPM
jgi:hypothetical protein